MIKKTIFIFIIICVSIYPQLDSAYLLTKNTGYRRFMKTSKELVELKKTKDADLIVDFDTIHFKYTKDRYYKWNALPLVGNFRIPMVDADKNGKLECYGGQWDSTKSSGGIFELNKPPKFLKSYRDTIRYFYDITSIKNDGKLNMVSVANQNEIKFYKQNIFNGLITDSDFVYLPSRPAQTDNLIFYDIDGDGTPELIYSIISDSIFKCGNEIAKYNPQKNNYERIYHHTPQPDYYTFGITTGDFDRNGKGNFVTGSVYGKMYVYEYVSENNYRVQFEKQTDCYNLFLQGFSNDLDGNGKPEIWMAGDFSSAVYGGMTRIFCFEPTSNDSYEQVYQIDIRGLFSAIYGDIRIADFDKDGKQELMVKNAAYMFFFKSSGIGKYYCDFAYKDPVSDSTLQNPVNDWGTDAKDLDGDGIPELLTINSYGVNSTPLTLILKKNIITGIKEDPQVLPSEYKLFQNYPNPFNGLTKIKFIIPDYSNVKIILRDILVREIKSLLDEPKNRGVYEISWDGKDNNQKNVASGIYFISFVAGSYMKTIKINLLK